MVLNYVYLLALVVFVLGSCLESKYLGAPEFVNISSNVFDGGNYNGLLAAFGDFNSDKLTDIFSVTEQGRTVEVLLAHETKPYLRKTKISCTCNNDEIITGVMPADYNGDSMMDILVTIHNSNLPNDTNHVRIFWGSYTRVDCTNVNLLTIRGHPLVMDYNGDMIPDLFGEGTDHKRYFWIADKNKTLVRYSVMSDASLQPLANPHSSAFLDLNGDMLADLFVTGQNSMEYWFNNDSSFEYNRSIPYPSAGYYGQSTFVDFDCNGQLDHIMPICNDLSCKNASIMIWNEKVEVWEVLLNNFLFDSASWGFKFISNGILEKSALSCTLRAGDFNMDGYPDFLVVLQSMQKGNQSKIILLENVALSTSFCGRTLVARSNFSVLNAISDNNIAAFYDLFEDGIIDILLSTKVGNEWKMYALQNTFSYDAYFIKVLVISGLCYSDCPERHIPYGTNQPGPMLRYSTVKPNGSPQVSCAVQMSQSAYFPLQLPYSVLGLGQTPNFVDQLTVAIPGKMDNTVRKHDWTQIIPNSQMVVIPYPPENPRRWLNKLFVTPSHLVILTLAALVGTCGVIAIIIGIFHWREKREDRREKLQEAHRFHFDAM